MVFQGISRVREPLNKPGRTEPTSRNCFDPIVKLSDAVEISDIPRDNQATQTGCLRRQDGVVRRLPAFFLVMAQNAGHAAREHHSPHGVFLRQIEDPVGADAGQKGPDLSDGIQCARVVRVEPTEGKGEFTKNDGGMVDGSWPDALLDVLRKLPLELIQDHAGVEHDPFAAHLRIGEEREVAVCPRG